MRATEPLKTPARRVEHPGCALGRLQRPVRHSKRPRSDWKRVAARESKGGVGTLQGIGASNAGVARHRGCCVMGRSLWIACLAQGRCANADPTSATPEPLRKSRRPNDGPLSFLSLIMDPQSFFNLQFEFRIELHAVIADRA